MKENLSGLGAALDKKAFSSFLRSFRYNRDLLYTIIESRLINLDYEFAIEDMIYILRIDKFTYLDVVYFLKLYVLRKDISYNEFSKIMNAVGENPIVSNLGMELVVNFLSNRRVRVKDFLNILDYFSKDEFSYKDRVISFYVLNKKLKPEYLLNIVSHVSSLHTSDELIQQFSIKLSMKSFFRLISLLSMYDSKKIDQLIKQYITYNRVEFYSSLPLICKIKDVSVMIDLVKRSLANVENDETKLQMIASFFASSKVRLNEFFLSDLLRLFCEENLVFVIESYLLSVERKYSLVELERLVKYCSFHNLNESKLCEGAVSFCLDGDFSIDEIELFFIKNTPDDFQSKIDLLFGLLTRLECDSPKFIKIVAFSYRWIFSDENVVSQFAELLIEIKVKKNSFSYDNKNYYDLLNVIFKILPTEYKNYFIHKLAHLHYSSLPGGLDFVEIYYLADLLESTFGKYRELNSILSNKVKDALKLKVLKEIYNSIEMENTLEVRDVIGNLPVRNLLVVWIIFGNCRIKQKHFKTHIAILLSKSLSGDKERFFEVPEVFRSLQNLTGDKNTYPLALGICSYVKTNRKIYVASDVAQLDVKSDLAKGLRNILTSTEITDDSIMQAIRLLSNNKDLGIIENDKNNISKIGAVLIRRSSEIIYLVENGFIEEIASVFNSVHDGCVANIGTQLNFIINSLLITDPAARILHRVISDFMLHDVVSYYIGFRRIDALGGAVQGLDYLTNKYITKNVIYPVALIEFLISNLTNIEQSAVLIGYFGSDLQRDIIISSIDSVKDPFDMEAVLRILVSIVIIKRPFSSKDFDQIKSDYFAYLNTSSRSREIVLAVKESLAKYELYEGLSNCSEPEELKCLIRNCIELNVELNDMLKFVNKDDQKHLLIKEELSYFVEKNGFATNSKELEARVSEAIKLGMAKADIISTVSKAANDRNPENRSGRKFEIGLNVRTFVDVVAKSIASPSPNY